MMSNSFLLLSAIMPSTPISSREQPTRRFTTPKKLQYGADSTSTATTAWKRDNRRQSFTTRFSVPTDKNIPDPQLRNSIALSHSSDSEGGSEVSVSKLKGWLDDFGKKQKNHCDKVTRVGHVPVDVSLQKPTRPKVQVKQPPKSIKRTTEQMKESRKGPTMTPVRFKSRMDEKVQATDNGYASVKELSAWLAGDPTANKTNRGCVRRGVNVINKSRMFEKDLEYVIIEEVGLQRGDVNDKKQWLENQAFQSDGNESDSDRLSAVTELVSVQDKKKWLNSAFGDKNLVKGGSLVDGGCDDRSAVSVNAKREWLQKAFKKGSERLLDVRNDTHDSATPAKKMWQAHAKRRSNRQLASATKTQVDASSEKPLTYSQPECEQLPVSEMKAPDERTDERTIAPVEDPILAISPTYQDFSGESNPFTTADATSEDGDAVNIASNVSNDQNQPSQQADVSPVVDFRTARQLLVQRSAANGNPVNVLTKVQMKKNKFERWQKETMKGTGPKGLLKPSWEPGAAKGRPSDQYVKTYLPNIAPQKSFDELP